MVQLTMSNKATKILTVKREAEDEPRGTLSKRSKLSQQQQGDIGTGDFPIPPSQYNPLDEPSPLGLRLRKSPSLLDLIQTTLSQTNSQKGATQVKKEHKPSNALSVSDKLKASNFTASLLRIGTWELSFYWICYPEEAINWMDAVFSVPQEIQLHSLKAATKEYKSRYEGDLVAKCYFAKHKLVWEVLDGGLKNKIEIQWSDIAALKANYPDDAPGTLDVVLSRQPLFFRETNPQPRKHTLWQATSDFTGGQASIQRRHFLQCPQGLMGKHFEKLVQCDPRLNFLSQQGEIEIDSPYFEPRVSVFEDPTSETSHGLDLNEEGQAFYDMRRAASPSGSQSSSLRSERDHVGGSSEQFPRHSTSPSSSVIDTHTIGDIGNNRAQELKGLLEKDSFKVPGLHPSMSMSDLVSHIENRISEQKSSNDFSFSSEGRQSLEILDEIRNCLFTESQNALATDEKCLMSRVNSLCCLLQKDPTQSIPKADSTLDLFEMDYKMGDMDSIATSAGEGDMFGFRQGSTMSRKDSLGDLLLNLPRIASLPQFLFNISEDSNSV